MSHWWLHEYKPWMTVFDNDGKAIRLLKGFPLPVKYHGQAFELIFITHDELTFYANDCHRVKYHHISEKACLELKGEGQSIMVSDFQTVKWGRLVDGEELSPCLQSLCTFWLLCISDTHIIFKAGTNCDGWFTSEDLLAQVDHTIDIFEGKTNGFTIGLWMFYNVPSHQKCARDALSAWKLPK